MYKKVLVPTDFSRYAHKVQDCLTALPGIEEIVLLHILDGSNPMDLEGRGWSWDSLIDEAGTRLAEQADHLSHGGEKKLRIKPVLKVIVQPMSGADGVNLQWPRPGVGVDLIQGGSVGEAVSKVAAEENVSLICMGAQGKGLVEGMLLGSVSTEVLRKGDVDLLLIRHKILQGEGGEDQESLCRDVFSRVMLTTDFSAAAEAAVVKAKGLSGVGELLLAHVIEKEEDFGGAAAKLNRLRDDLAGEKEGEGRNVTVHVLQGHPTEEILGLASNQDVSLIMMCSQGKSWSRQMRVGSTTFDVARRAECPVLVVRPAGK